MDTYFKNSDVFFRPIQERGINVIISVMPDGNGAAIGNLFSSSSWTSAMQQNFGMEYPFGGLNARRFIEEVADYFIKNNIDGVGYDEEYIGQWTPPFGAPIDFARDGANILRFAYELNKAVGRPLIHEIYEYGTSLPVSTTFRNFAGEMTTVYRDEIIDWTYSVAYGGWNPISRFGTPRHKYGPASIAVADVQSAPRPPFDDMGGTGIRPRMRQVLHGGYGVVMFYCLRSRNQLIYGYPTLNLPNFPANMYGPGNAGRPEAYFSIISQVLFGQNTIYVGDDVPRGFYRPWTYEPLFQVLPDFPNPPRPPYRP